MIYVRTDAKQHGKENLIEGHLEHGKKVLIIEDLISTGKSSLAAVEAVRQAGGVVTNCITIFTYDFPIAHENFKRQRCTLHTLSNFESIIKIASSKGYLKQEDITNVLKWNKNPEQWGR